MRTDAAIDDDDDDDDDDADDVKVECEVKDEEEVSVQHLMERLRHHVLVNRIRVKEYFADFDPLRSGCVTKARFERGLSYMGVSALGQHHLTAAQLATISHVYEDPNDPLKVAWTRFAADMESVFTLPNLEYTPSVQVSDGQLIEVIKLHCQLITQIANSNSN